MEKLINFIFLLPPTIGFICLFIGLALIYRIYKETMLLHKLWSLLALLVIAFISGYAAILLTTLYSPTPIRTLGMSLLYGFSGILILFATFAILKTLRAMRELHTLELQNKTLSHVTTHDYLTRLKNRATLMTDLHHFTEMMKRGAPPCSLLYIDIDNFKQFNVDYGYACGDYLLTKIAEIFTKRTRKTDIIARYGSDGFVIVLYNANVEQAEHFARMLIIKLAGIELMYKHHSFTISCSIGIAPIEPEGTGEKIIESAQQAHALGRQAGNGQVNVALKT